MGKKQASSSSRAAERLLSGGALTFVGFDALSSSGAGDVGFVPPSTVENSEIAIANPDAAVFVTKLTKRDATTKYKALRSLLDLVATHDDAENIALDVAKHWPRIYRRLSLDVDRRVRVQTQQLLGRICALVGKKLTIHINGLIGPWLAAQHDPSHDVAAAAKESFTSTFPTPEKQQKLFTFCAESIITYAKDILLTQTKESLADLQGTALDDHETTSLYERAVSSTLLSLATSMKYFATSQNENAMELLADTISASKLWKLGGKHQTSPLIKRGVLDLVTHIAKHNSTVLDPVLKKATVTAFGAVVDGDVKVARSSWNAVLHLVNYIPSCWQSLDPRKGIWPHVWTLLKSGAAGNTEVVFHSMAGFLNHVPRDVIGAGVGFHNVLLNSMWAGFVNQRTKPHDCLAIFRGIMDVCSQIIIMQRNVADSDDRKAVLAYAIEFACLTSINAVETIGVTTSTSRLVKFVVGVVSDAETTEQAISTNSRVTTTTNDLLWAKINLLCIDLVNHTEPVVTFPHDVGGGDDGGGGGGGDVGGGGDGVRATLDVRLEKRMKDVDHNDDAQDEVSTTVDIDVTSLWTSDFVNLCSHEQILSTGTASLVNKLCSRLSKEISLKNMKLMESITTSCCCLNVFGTTGEAASTISNIIKSEFVPHMLSNNNNNNPTTTANEHGEVTEAMIATSVSLAIIARASNVDETTVGTLLEEILTACSSSTKYLAHFLDESDRGATQLPDWKHETVKQKIFDVAVKAISLKMLENGQLNSDVLRLLRIPLTDGVDRGYVSSQQHIELLQLLNKAMDATLGASKSVSDKEILLLTRLFPIIHKTTPSECVVESRTLLGNLVLATAAMEKDDLPPPSQQLHLVETTQQILQRFDQAEMASEKQASIDHLRSIFGVILNEADGVFGRNIKAFKSAALVDVTTVVARAITSTLTALNYEHTCLTAALPSKKVLEQLRRHLFEAVPFSPDYLIVQKLNCGSSWATNQTKQMRGKATSNDTRLKLFTWGTQLLYLCKVLSIASHKQLVNTDAALVGELVSELFQVQAALPSARASFGAIAGGHRLYAELETMMNTFPDVSTDLLESKEVAAACVSQLCVSLQQQPVLDMLVATSFHVVASALDDDALENLFQVLFEQVRNGPAKGVSCNVLQYLLAENVHPSLSALRKMDVFSSNLAESPVLLTVAASMLRVFYGLPTTHETSQETSQTSSVAPPLQDGNPQPSTTTPTTTSTTSTSTPTPTSTTSSTSSSSSSNKLPDAASRSRLLAERAETRRQMVIVGQHSQTAWNVIQPLLTQLRGVSDDGVLSTDGDSEEDCNETEWSQRLRTSVDAAVIFRIAVVHGLAQLSAAEWDLILCSTLCWMETNVNTIAQHSVVAVAASVVAAVQTTFASVTAAQAKGVGPRPDADVLKTMVEWNDFFVPAIGEQIVKKLFATSQSEMGSALKIDLATAVLIVPQAVAIAHTNVAQVAAMFTTTTSKEICLACHHILIHFVVEFGKTEEDIENKDEIPWLVCDLCERLAQTPHDSLWAWKLSLACLVFCKLFEGATIMGKSALAAKLRSSKAVTMALDCWLDVMDTFKIPESQMSAIITRDFSTCRSLISTNLEGSGLSILSCHTLFTIILVLPVIARDWFQDLGRQLTANVATFAAKHISPFIIELELYTVNNNTDKDESMEISTRNRAKEVVGVYSMEEMTMEVVVAFDAAHPLKQVTVTCGRRVGVQTSQWRNWLLQMTTFMSNQNGSVLDGFKIWKRNVDKRFEGVEECTICYAVIHPTNYALPDKRCRTCKNGFHSACLFKWFNSSQQSSCPLCRNLWMN